MFIVRVALPTFSCIEQFIITVLNFKGSIKTITYDNLITKLCDYTKTKKGKFYISWHDGVEYCTISNTLSFREALVRMTYDREDKTPLLFASPVLQLNEKKLPSFYGGCRPENLPKDFRERASRAEFTKDVDYEEPNLPIITELICDVCNKHNWSGDRFTCVVCPRVVLCPDCFRNNNHSKHPMLITRESAEFPCPVLQAVRIVASDITAEDSDEDEYEYEHSDSSDPRTSSSTATDATDNITKTIGALREMGFKQNTNELVELVIKERGNLQTIVEKLAN
ncbi:hypothetical protein EWB00_006878 [Schistosoma japonicum]|uniref:ZZ-type domain-containing protein n=1 Tax=Schistosoma japonicum TaxID=6182 RepID=A0A4Z2CWH9_SCHJA|nr:hypothetical protein EWB00_006878 [Schistosoma japonicum]